VPHERESAGLAVRALRAAGVGLAVSAALAGCTSATAPKATYSSGPVTLASRSIGVLGDVLVNGAGRTLYVSVRETGANLSCDSQCESVWPLVLLRPGLRVQVTGDGVNPRLVGTRRLSNVGTVVTYAGHPLHTYLGDTAAGQADGQGVEGRWYPVSVSGQPARSASTGSPST
jgi:predicted lipoprotein with Yx(FWY)xxD motif